MPDAATLLGNAPHRPAPGLSLGPGAGLRLARVHELCGNARWTLALMIAARAGTGPARPLIWIAPTWDSGRLNGDGMSRFLPPAHVVFVTAPRAEDVLWTAEEVLRSGAAALMVADLPGLPTLTAVRRMHLAAETGAEATGRRYAPLGLILTAGDGGAPGVESRWRLDARHGAGQTGWRLDRLRARSDPPKRWSVAWRGGGPELSASVAD
ncbi:hypothetical protein ATO6_21495 [Oceanicola sp. 22II-s10i]|uniref:ImuA family protein n=1 Tax=Oceanicola sp. 22II-s10i TaxID=1317116 RepID=UPI000B6F7E29|nr:hypothetical protein [Oceanicola sp. 22II-s10i]OWU82883.1 hypothetical protein ATO6_21495 [Oceanicola sp. 22II-s10i]